MKPLRNSASRRSWQLRRRTGACKQRAKRGRQLALEPLETRLVLDGGMATLANDAFDVGQNSPPAPLDVLANDLFSSDYAGARRITSVSYGSEGGSIQIAADGKSLTYAPPADFFGSETFVYVVDDQQSAQVQVQIRAPLAFDSYNIPPDGAERRLDVLANDPFWPGYSGPREITSISVSSAGGDVRIGEDGRSIFYTPPEEAYGTDEFIYIVDGVYPARVTIKIPETLKPDTVEVVQHTQATFFLLANDPFWPGYTGDRRITHILDADEGATVVISSDGRSVTYTPAPNASGGDSFRYVVDSAYETYVSVQIHRPVRDDWFETDENSVEHSFNVTANDRYRDKNNVERDVIDRVTSVTQSQRGGAVAISADGQSVVYTPPAGFKGADSFTYLADGVHEATVYVQVNRPVRDDYISQGVYEDTPNSVLNVLANDFLGNGYQGARLITSVGAAEHGEVRIGSDGRWLVYTPAAGYVGQDAFTYTVDGQLEARVTVQVQPLAVGDSYLFDADPSRSSYTLNVLNNDHFLEGYQGPGVITAVSDIAGSGQVTIVDGRTLLFTPGPTGGASFTYTVDGKYQASVWASIRNRLSGDSAVVDQNSDAQTLDVLANDFYNVYPYTPYLGPRLITGVSQSQKGGVVSIAADGKTVRYEPPDDYHGDDSFTYTVDGIMQTTVQVRVIRRVRDDQFRVDGPAEESLPVLVNDLFGADYRGAGRITAVSATSAGGSVAISIDGRSIHYAPAAGFSGADSFVYTVDGRLKASVQVHVGAQREDQFPTFGSLENYQQFLIDDALARYEHLFGRPAWHGYLDTAAGGPIAFGPEGAPRDHSETNVQVAGVDEGDIIEFDADYVYVLTDEGLAIVDAWPAADMTVASRVDIEGRPIAEYLHGDRLTVISTTGGEFSPWDVIDLGPRLGGPAVDGFFGPWRPMTPSTTIVTVIDVTDRSAPAVVQTTSMQGRYVDSRAIGDYVYVLVSNDNAVAPPPEVIPLEAPDEGDPPIFVSGVYETRDEYLARVTANPGKMIDGALPNYTAYGPDGEVARTGLLNEPEGIFRPLAEGVRNLISVASFNVESDEPGLASTSAVYTSGASTVYASLDNFYVFDHDYSTEDGALTRIMKFDWDAATGGVDFTATTTVAGSILNQFSADEDGEFLRIATTIGNGGSGNWSGREENALFVLRDDGGVFEPVGSLQNLALDETIRSVRYIGDRAFITTFRTIDPLFGLDLSDPANPRALGHLTLPGFSSYMQLIDETHLLTVGQNTPNGFGGPTQVALFDVSDLTQPRRIDEYTFQRFSTSEAQIDHHAFGYFAAHGLLAIPTNRTHVERVDEDGDGYRESRKTVYEDMLSVLTIDVDAGSSAIALAGEIPHATAVRRSGYIDAYLYSASNDSVKVAPVSNPGGVIGEVILVEEDDSPPDPGPPTPIPASRFPALPANGSLAAAVDKALAHLAAHTDTAPGAAMAVTVEATGDAETCGYHVVLRAGDQHFLYYVRGNDSVLLANDEFSFAGASESGAWHAVGASTLPGDHDLDGDADGDDLAVWRAAHGVDAAGDSDGDGDSDGADFLAWQRNLGAHAHSRVVAAHIVDSDGDGDSDGADFLSWQRGLGAASPEALADAALALAPVEDAAEGAPSPGPRELNGDLHEAALQIAAFAPGALQSAANAASTLDDEPANEDVAAWDEALLSDDFDARESLSLTAP